LAIAFWRNALASALLVPATVLRRRDELRALARPDRRASVGLCLCAGVALAVHFATWIPSAKLTSIAAATAPVATPPPVVGPIPAVRGRALPSRTWLGIGIAVAGAIVATGADFGVSGRAVLGDGLALAGSAAGAVYTVLGERVRVSLSTTTYTALCYGTCAG